MAKRLFLFVILLLVGMPAFAHVDTAWVRRYDGAASGEDVPRAMVVAPGDTVYVTGTVQHTYTNRDIGTVAYDHDGDTVWVRMFNGPSDGFDDGHAMDLDDSGYVYVAGESFGSGPGDFITVKYKPNGDTVWTARWDDYDERVFDVAVDGNGCVYATGTSCRPQGQGDIITIKYNSDGSTAWRREYKSPTGGADVPWAIAVDDSGYSYVTGRTNGGQYVGDYVTIKYRPNGDSVWVSIYDGPGDSLDWAYDIAVDGSGNVYVTGHSYGDGTDLDYATIKYLPDGDTAWVRRYDGSASGKDGANALAIDASGNVYVTGYSDRGKAKNDYVTIKYDSNGSVSWTKTYNSSNLDDEGKDIAVDGGGNVYVTGKSKTSATDDDFATIRYYPNGNTAWVERYNGPTNEKDQAACIALNDSNHVYVTGRSYGGLEDYDYATINYVQFLCGDANSSGVVEAGDITYLTNYLYRQGPPPDPIQAGDCNMDGIVDTADVTYLVNYLYRQGPEPCAE